MAPGHSYQWNVDTRSGKKVVVAAQKQFMDWPEKYSYFKEGKLASLEGIKAAAVVAAGPEPGVINAFDEQGTFYEWATGFEFNDRIREVPVLVDQLRKRQESNLEYVMASQQRRVKAIVAEGEEIAKELGMPVGSVEVLSLMTGADPLRGALFDPMVLWDLPCGGPNCYGSGAWLPAFGPMPDYRWFGYNDRASHVWASGLNVLCEHIWWGGRWAWILGLPSTHFDLINLGFDNIASSSLLI
ncbi:MAG TPA: hypothetical protein VFT22_01725 [Kofleriaceae bacterium]|nr:hypothetical protein [Kofleriaceae bacterium]